MRCAGALSLSKDTILRLDMLSAHVEMRRSNRQRALSFR